MEFTYCDHCKFYQLVNVIKLTLVDQVSYNRRRIFAYHYNFVNVMG